MGSATDLDRWAIIDAAEMPPRSPRRALLHRR